MRHKGNRWCRNSTGLKNGGGGEHQRAPRHRCTLWDLARGTRAPYDRRMEPNPLLPSIPDLLLIGGIDTTSPAALRSGRQLRPVHLEDRFVPFSGRGDHNSQLVMSVASMGSNVGVSPMPFVSRGDTVMTTLG